jgi:hypothetical protein
VPGDAVPMVAVAVVILAGLVAVMAAKSRGG